MANVDLLLSCDYFLLGIMLVLLTVIINMYNQEEKALYCLHHSFCLEAYGSSCTQYAKSEVYLLTGYTVFL